MNDFLRKELITLKEQFDITYSAVANITGVPYQTMRQFICGNRNLPDKYQNKVFSFLEELSLLLDKYKEVK